jgi:hypothetical protein
MEFLLFIYLDRPEFEKIATINIAFSICTSFSLLSPYILVQTHSYGLQLRNYIGLVWTYQLYDSAGQPYPWSTSTNGKELGRGDSVKSSTSCCTG